jgi:hypothetical protein
MGGMTAGALYAKTAKNKLAFADNPISEKTRGGLRHIAPIHVLDITAAVANEVVMPLAFRIETRSPALDRDFAHQSCFHQVSQIVVGRCPGRARIYAIYSFKNFRSRGMPRVIGQEGHDGIALRGAPQPTAQQRSLDRLRTHFFSLDYI